LYFTLCSFVRILYVSSYMSTLERSVQTTVWKHNGWTADDIPTFRHIMIRLNNRHTHRTVGYPNTKLALTCLTTLQRIIQTHVETLCLDRCTDVAVWNIYKPLISRTTYVREKPFQIQLALQHFTEQRFCKNNQWKTALCRPSAKLLINP
jgi:hypothetical protein